MIYIYIECPSTLRTLIWIDTWILLHNISEVFPQRHNHQICIEMRSHKGHLLYLAECVGLPETRTFHFTHVNVRKLPQGKYL